MSVRPTKTQISLGIRSVWTESSQCDQWVAEDPRFLHANSEDWSDWADAQADLCLRWTHNHFVGFVMSRLIWRLPLAPWHSRGLVLFLNLSRTVRKCVLCHMRTTKAQISLRIMSFIFVPSVLSIIFIPVCPIFIFRLEDNSGDKDGQSSTLMQFSVKKPRSTSAVYGIARRRLKSIWKFVYCT